MTINTLITKRITTILTMKNVSNSNGKNQINSSNNNNKETSSNSKSGLKLWAVFTQYWARWDNMLYRILILWAPNFWFSWGFLDSQRLAIMSCTQSFLGFFMVWWPVILGYLAFREFSWNLKTPLSNGPKPLQTSAQKAVASNTFGVQVQLI